jgi:hypothetical protein
MPSHYSARGHFTTVTAVPAPAVAHEHHGCYQVSTTLYCPLPCMTITRDSDIADQHFKNQVYVFLMVARNHDVAMCFSWPSNFLYKRVVLILLISRWAEVYLLPCARVSPRRAERYFQGCRCGRPANTLSSLCCPRKLGWR